MVARDVADFKFAIVGWAKLTWSNVQDRMVEPLEKNDLAMVERPGSRFDLRPQQWSNVMVARQAVRGRMVPGVAWSSAVVVRNAEAVVGDHVVPGSRTAEAVIAFHLECGRATSNKFGCPDLLLEPLPHSKW